MYKNCCCDLFTGALYGSYIFSATFAMEIKDIMGCVKVASIMSQTQGKYYYWLGAVHKWRYLFARDVPVEESKKA